MSAFVPVAFVLGLLLFGIASLMVGYLLWMSSRKRSYAEPRTIICPENLDYATVTADGAYAARTALEGQELYRIASCSRWPEMLGCDQECADQVPLAGDDRTHGEYVPFGMTPAQLRSETPVKVTPEMYRHVMRQKLNQDVERRPA